MKLFAAVFLGVFAVAFGRTVYKNDDRIVGGEETNVESFPYQISLQLNGRHWCGGSIINENTIVTATHCVNGRDYSAFTVKAGVTDNTEDVEVYEIAEIIEHPGYSEGYSFNNDITIIKLVDQLVYSDKIQPIEFATDPVPEGTTAYVSGWGDTQETVPDPNILRVTDVNVISRRNCRNAYGSNKISDNMLCAAAPGKDSCQGDSGGPLAANGKLIGVVSWGRGCADPYYPGVYADVSVLKDFIVENM